MVSLLQQRPTRPRYLRVNMLLCAAAIAALGAQSAAAQNCFLFFCRGQPDWQARPAGKGRRCPNRTDEAGHPSHF